MNLRLLLIVSLFSLLQACAVGPKFHVNIDSINAPDSEQKTNYVLLSGQDNIDAESLEFQEYAAYINRALTAQGFTKASTFDEADVAIFLVYGIGEPKESQYSYSLPTYGKTGIASSNTTGSVSSNGNTATYSGTTTYNPSYGITGSKSYTGTRVTYFRNFVLDAIDLEYYRLTQKEKQIWKTTVTSSGSSGDLRQVFPILVAAGKGYIGTNTGKKIKVVLRENDKRVVEIRGINNK